MQLFYRISDKGYPKVKLPGATKEACLDSFIEAFPGCELTVICDNCKPETVAMVEARQCHFIETSLGNSGSMMRAIDLSMMDNDNQPVYFCEDDYLHLPNAKTLLEEGLKLGHYVTLYDHPDKYTAPYEFGEISKVMKSPSSHWRFTASTCMTFGTTIGKLRADYEVFKQQCEYEHPHDHFLFLELQKRGCKLAVCIPGAACHTDLTVSGNLGEVALDQWAIYMMVSRLEGQLKEIPEMKGWLAKASAAPNIWDRLIKLAAITDMAGLS